jgi:RHH-type proline utilization regulon transcriptional repressor/proline dehydrogenase/delta 1-pyrroline-5-carboxylate dehydrogenase
LKGIGIGLHKPDVTLTKGGAQMVLVELSKRLAECNADDNRRLALVAAGLARQIQLRAKQLQTPSERRQQAELDRLIQRPSDKATLMQMTDQAFRSRRAARAADQLAHILDVQGVPRFFSPIDRTILRGFQSFGSYLPGVAVPLVKEKMRHETANVILPAEPDLLAHHLRQRSGEGVRMNVNFLGEAILSEPEAQRRIQAYLDALRMPEVECVSIKASTLFSQLSTVARSQTIQVLIERLERLYRAAGRERYRRGDGTEVPKFVYLDMEEYRDMELTGEVFMKTLDLAGMEKVSAGIALQAYVPDSFLLQKRIAKWARQRTSAGGAPVTVRIVKGANMEMERVEASLRGWPQAPYERKVETDANYKRMIAFALKPENICSAHLGVGSHNLFDISFALVLAFKREAIDRIQIEMLEGMANHQRRAIFEIFGRLLLYAPACKRNDFIHAIGYLVRRMDENTGPENFLRHAFKIEVDSPQWRSMESSFLESIDLMNELDDQPRRKQDRFAPPGQPEPPTDWRCLHNEPDTDFSLPRAAEWAHFIISSWENRCDSRASQVLLSVGDKDEQGQGPTFRRYDPSRPGVLITESQQASALQMRRAVEIAAADPCGWSRMKPLDRYQLLRKAAQQIRIRRADLMGAALAEAGKTLLESDPEVSEAVDFVEFYARLGLDIFECPGGFSWGENPTAPHQLDQIGETQASSMGAGRTRCRPRGPTVVISPWNFPIAIPCGGISAALAAANTVILKPAVETALVARLLCECFWEAGIPKSALQLIVCDGAETSQHLLSQSEVATCVFTGGTETALQILAQRPCLHLLAETGGKNATVVSSLSDRDLAIKNILHSAFSHSGQKCSATSLLLLEEEVYYDGSFMESLREAAASLTVGSAWDPRTKVGPLIRPPRAALLRGLTQLEQKENWLLRPENQRENPCLFSPGIKRNVQPGSFSHRCELFGPVLSVMKYSDLGEALEIIHQTGFGLTSGLESLDDREQQYWLSHSRSGNLYVNRTTTGAIVLRQPFGGTGKSAFGPGIKAGGPNYLVPLMHFSPGSNHSSHQEWEMDLSLEALAEFWNLLQSEFPAAKALMRQIGQSEIRLLASALQDYDRFASQEISQIHDTLKLVGQDNLRRYRPMSQLRIRLSSQDSQLYLLAQAAVVAATGARGTMSKPPGVLDHQVELMEKLTDAWAVNLEFIEETNEELVEAISGCQVERLRYSCPEVVPSMVRKAANEKMVYIADQPFSGMGRVDLMWGVREQSISVDYHRYGNLGQRAE